MIRIDDTLLEELGLMALPESERRQMLKQIYETLEMRVGMRLAERMSDQQLDEFEKFIDGDLAYVEGYLNQLKPGWAQSPEYAKEYQLASETATKSGNPFNENAVKSQFGALTWLETNFPDYKQVVASELDKLKLEIKQDSAKIIEAAGSVQPLQPEQSNPQASIPQPNYDQNQQPPMAA